MTGTSGRHRRSHWTVMAALTLVVGGAISLPSSAAGDADRAGQDRHGYPIPATGRADSGWIGGRTVDGELAYRIDPRARDVSTRYRTVELVDDLRAARRPSARATHRAACVLSTYGARRDAIQSAAVDAATFHLLAGGTWRLGKQRGMTRIRQSGPYRRYVRSYAREMLRQCTATAGPYRTTLTTTPAAAGSASRATFTVLSAGGNGVPNLPVSFTDGHRVWTATTDASGRATVNVAVTAPGLLRLAATATRVPEWRLAVRAPRHGDGSPVAVGGRQTSLVGTGDVVGSGVQSLGISMAAGTTRWPTGPAGSFQVVGGEGARSAVLTVHGPFLDSAAGCAGAPAWQGTSMIDAAGSYPLPAWQPAVAGYYRWQVSVSGNDFSTAATACGSPVRVQRQASVSQFRPASRSHRVAVGEHFDVGAVVSGFDWGEQHQLTFRLYGPFAHAENMACRPDRLMASKTHVMSIAGNGSYDSADVAINNPDNAGYYVWQTTLSDGDLALGGVSYCDLGYRVVP